VLERALFRPFGGRSTSPTCTNFTTDRTERKVLTTKDAICGKTKKKERVATVLKDFSEYGRVCGFLRNVEILDLLFPNSAKA